MQDTPTRVLYTQYGKNIHCNNFSWKQDSVRAAVPTWRLLYCISMGICYFVTNAVDIHAPTYLALIAYMWILIMETAAETQKCCLYCCVYIRIRPI